MKALFLLFLTLPAMALPTLEEARSLLGSSDAKERAATTLEIWEAGNEALPFLQTLAKDRDPEIANRATYILRRFRMGLTPESPPELLGLAEALEQATPDQRTKHLTKLLDHKHGTAVALHLLNRWASREANQPKPLLAHASQIAYSLLEQRFDWQKFFTTELSAPCRAILIYEISKEDLPMKPQIIAILGRDQPDLVYSQLQKLGPEIDQVTVKSLARVAIVGQNLPLAIRILSDHLDTAPEADLARSLAFLEASSGLPLPPYQGIWKNELKVFQARLRKDHQLVPALTSKLRKDPFLKYENLLLSGQLSLPKQKGNEDFFSNELALNALHSAFATPPSEPDIEALSAEILIDWSDLARSLTLLGRPVEASETLAANDQSSSAVNLLWRTGHREKALTLAKEFFNKPDVRAEAKMRIIMTSHFLDAGDKDAATEVFEPLIYMGSMNETYRKKAISLGLQLYPREELLPLAPGLNAKQAYLRAPAISHFLPYPDKVSVFWYEHFLSLDEFQSPTSLFKKVENILNDHREEARRIISEKLATSSKDILLPSDALYQNILFLKLPIAPEVVKKAAWYQLSTKDLLGIFLDQTWPEETRLKALKTAILIDPIKPSLHWHLLQQGGQLDLDTLHHLTLGDPTLSLQLAALTGKRDSLKLAAEIADLRNSDAIRCLTILAKSQLENEQAHEAARLYQTARLGEIAIGTQPATPIQATLENLSNYLQARLIMAKDDSEKEVWQQRLKAIGKGR